MSLWYLAGPMSGHPQFNFPLFDRVATELRARGFNIVSPAELDSPEVRAEALASPTGIPAGMIQAAGMTWGDFLARDVKLLADGGVTGILLLPQWCTSRGAKLEAFVGLLNNLQFGLVGLTSDTGGPGILYVERSYVARTIHNAVTK